MSMIRLEITGATPEEFLKNALGTLAALAGLRAKPAAAPAEPQTAPSPTDAIVEGCSVSTSEPVTIDAEPEKDNFPQSDDVTATTTKRTRKPRGSTEVEAKPEVTDEPVQKVNETSAAPVITIDDIRTRVRDVINGFKATVDKDDPKAEAKSVEYTSKLFALFGMKKVSDLAAERYAEFMSTSESWLEGKQA